MITHEHALDILAVKELIQILYGIVNTRMLSADYLGRSEIRIGFEKVSELSGDISHIIKAVSVALDPVKDLLGSETLKAA